MRRIEMISLLALCLAALLLLACPGDDDERTGCAPPLTARTAVAQISLTGGDFEVRQPGEVVFERWKKEMGNFFPRGTTIRSGEGILTFNFMQCIPINLSPRSVLILQGAVNGPRGKEFVLGLKEGEIWVNFGMADYPVAIKMPHGEVRGLRGMVRIEKLRFDEKGGYRANVHALSRGITVSNDKGSITLPDFGVVRLVEDEPPKVLQERGPGGQRKPYIPFKDSPTPGQEDPKRK